MAIPRKEELALSGSAGRLETIIELPDGVDPTAMALICHPHPLHGGTMQNKVTYTLARSFVALGAAALRFNFRGVGASEGQFDDGVGELDDAIAAADYLQARWPSSSLYIAGFSFGAAIAAEAAERLRPKALVTVALPVDRLALPFQPPPVPWLLIHGSEDALVDVDRLIEWLNGLGPGPELDIVDGADHFFHGKLAALRTSVEAFVERATTGSVRPDEPV